MYKVESYKFNSESNKEFTHGQIYYLRNSKDGMKKFLTTNDINYELEVSASKISMSLISSHYSAYLKNNFTYVGYTIYDNYKEFRKQVRFSKADFSKSDSSKEYKIEKLNDKLINLNRATKIVLEDILSNYYGRIPEEYLKNIDTDKVSDKLMKNDYFLIDFIKHGEMIVSGYIKNYLDE